MSYQYQGPPGQYNQPPGYGGFPHQSAPPPGMEPPPGLPAPGTSGAPGVQQPQQNQGGLPQNFDPRTSMPGFNFSAPVIRLGMSGQDNKPSTPAAAGHDRRGGNAEPISNRRGMGGVGYDSRGNQNRDRDVRDVTLKPQTREEIARTLFIGNITDAFGSDADLEDILSAGGGLRKFLRAFDATEKPCSFGFAEYDSADSLAVAVEVLSDVQIKSKDQPQELQSRANRVKTEEDAMIKDVKAEPGNEASRDSKVKKEEDDDHGDAMLFTVDTVGEQPVKMDELRVIIDDASQRYINDWKGSKEQKSEADAESRQFHVDGAKQDLEQTLRNIANPQSEIFDHIDTAAQDGLPIKAETVKNEKTGQVVEIPLTVEDELSDIPSEMRETVTKEIAAFRDRSHQRDLERLKQEEAEEARERARNATPTVGGNANNIPLGPRGQHTAPTGPRGSTGVQIPKDYQRGVAFVNGTTMNGVTGLSREEEESDASDEELERRRNAKHNNELEKMFLDQERKWINRERSRTAAIEREREYEADEAARTQREKRAARQTNRAFDDDQAALDREKLYYSNRIEWLRRRAEFRSKEAAIDERDRNLEERERQLEQERRNKEAGVADEFLAEQAKELESQLQRRPTREPMKFKMGLGSSAKREQQTVEEVPRRSMAALEGLLEDEDDVARREKGNRQLMPMAEDFSKNSGLSAEERLQKAHQLAKEIPSDRRGLWAWSIKWEHVNADVVSQLREFVEKKVVETLGVMEERQVDTVIDAIKKRDRPEHVADKVTPALGDEAKDFVRKLWRMLVFLSESEARGIAE